MVGEDTYTDKLVRKWKNNRIIAIFIAVTLVVIGLGTLTGAIDNLINFASKYFVIEPEVSELSDSEIPEETSLVIISIPSSDESDINKASEISPKSPIYSITKEDQEFKNSKLFTDAEEHIASLRLTTPIGNNAFEIYGQILKIDPENKRALAGLEEIAKKYIEIASIAITKQEMVRAELYLDKAESIYPNVPNLFDTRLSLKQKSVIPENKPSITEEIATEIFNKDGRETIKDDTISKNVVKPDTKDTAGQKEQENNLDENNTKCEDEDTLNYILVTASEIYSSTKRDRAYKIIIGRALCSKNYEIAGRAAESIFSSIARDEAIIDIIKSAISDNKFNYANSISNSIYSSTKRDKTKQMIIDSITNND